MTLRNRVTLAAGLAVLVTAMATSAVVYTVVRDNLYEQVDASLAHQDGVDHDLLHEGATVPEDLPLAHDVFRQVVDRDGHIVTAWGERALPVTGEVLAAAQ